MKFEIKRSLIFISILAILILSIGMASASEEISDSVSTEIASEDVTTEIQTDNVEITNLDEDSSLDDADLEKDTGDKVKKAKKRINTKIIYQNMSTTAVVNEYDGRTGEYFNVTLVDEDDKPVVGELIQIGFNGRIYNRTTDSNGGAQLQINLAYSGPYTFAICYLGEDTYESSFEVAVINVAAKKMTLTVPSKSYKASAKTKTLTATLKDNKGNLIKSKQISFTVNGKTYSAKTDSKGVATVKVSLSTRKTYIFTAKFAGDKSFGAVTKTGKVTIK